MGSMLKFESDGRQLRRKRRLAKAERKEQRREARKHKRSQTGEPIGGLSAAQRIAEQDVRRELDGIVDVALERHNSPGASETRATAPPAGSDPATRAGAPDPRRHTEREAGSRTVSETSAPSSAVVAERRASHHKRDIAEFRERQRNTIKTARAEAKGRIRQAGEPAAVGDAFAAIQDPGAGRWRAERDQLEQALASAGSQTSARRRGRR